jgi:hypothetical protein
MDVLSGFFIDFSTISFSSLLTLALGVGSSGPSSILDVRFRSQHQGNLDALFEVCDVANSFDSDVIFFIFFFINNHNKKL